MPKGTPDTIIARLNRETDKILSDPEIRTKLENQGTSPVGGSPAAFQKMLAEDYSASKALVQSAGCVRSDGDSLRTRKSSTMRREPPSTRPTNSSL